MHSVRSAHLYVQRLCLNGNGEMRALQRESQFLLGEWQVVVRLDRVVWSGQVLVWSLTEVAAVWVFCHRTRTREWVAVMGVHAGHADWILLVMCAAIQNKEKRTHH
jgi:hypothetical protein